MLDSCSVRKGESDRWIEIDPSNPNLSRAVKHTYNIIIIVDKKNVCICIPPYLICVIIRLQEFKEQNMRTYVGVVPNKLSK